jgi:hypothetical protein
VAVLFAIPASDGSAKSSLVRSFGHLLDDTTRWLEGDLSISSLSPSEDGRLCFLSSY